MSFQDGGETAVIESRRRLAKLLRSAIEAKAQTVDSLSATTKVPRGTILSLLDEPVAAVLPERAYLRGQLLLLVAALAMDRTEVMSLFDAANPSSPPARADSGQGLPLDSRSMAIAAGLACIALLAVVLAFVR